MWWSNSESSRFKYVSCALAVILSAFSPDYGLLMASSSYFIYFAIIGLVLSHFEIRDCSFLGRHSFPFLSRGVGGRGAVWYFCVIFFHIPSFFWLVPLNPFSGLTAHQQTPRRSTSSSIHCRDFLSAVVASTPLWLAISRYGFADWIHGGRDSHAAQFERAKGQECCPQGHRLTLRAALLPSGTGNRTKFHGDRGREVPISVVFAYFSIFRLPELK